MQNEVNTKTVEELEILESKLASASDAITEAQHVISEMRLKRDQPELPMTSFEEDEMSFAEAFEKPPALKFEVGDKVICVKDAREVDFGGVYTVEASSQMCQSVKVSNRTDWWYCASTFEKVEEEKVEPQTVAGIDEEEIRPETPTTTFLSIEDLQAHEIARLQRELGNKDFEINDLKSDNNQLLKAFKQATEEVEEEEVKEPTYEELLERQDVQEMLEKELSCPVKRQIAVEVFGNDKETMVRAFVEFTDNQSKSEDEEIMEGVSNLVGKLEEMLQG